MDYDDEFVDNILLNSKLINLMFEIWAVRVLVVYTVLYRL